MKISIIVPSLNEGAVILPLLQSLQAQRTKGHEVLLSDGGSTDDTVALAQPLVDQVIQGDAGRASQMNRAAAQAQGDILWFVHADTAWLNPVDEIIAAISQNKVLWGFCRVRIAAQPLIYRVIESLMNWRACLSRVATGDQGIFVQRKVFQQIGGYPNIPLMEDVALSKALRKIARPACLRQTLITSARRWQTHGVAQTILLMWRLRFAYFLGVPPQYLARYYRVCSSPKRKL